MLTTVCVRPTLWEALLPSEALVMPAELVAVDRLLDDPRFFEPFRVHFDPGFGRPSIPIEPSRRPGDRHRPRRPGAAGPWDARPARAQPW